MINQRELRTRLPAEQRIAKRTHAGLWLDSYIEDQQRGEAESRRRLVEEVAELPEPPIYRRYFARWQAMLEKEPTAQTRPALVKSRMIVGLGSESVLETAICLHRTYGVPYIPGSALKGLAASYARQYLDEEWQQGGKFHTIVFGTTEEAGYITFYDALYLPGSGYKGQALYPDVITVHHQNYYQGAQEVPRESDDPNPVPLLSATGTYLLALAAPAFREQTRWIDLTFMILAEALKTLGIGAKTSSGYGRMELLDPAVRPLDPELRQAEGYRREIEALRDVASQIPAYHQKWQKLASPQARKLVAEAIVEKVRLAGREKATTGKAWYQELQAFLKAFQE